MQQSRKASVPCLECPSSHHGQLCRCNHFKSSRLCKRLSSCSAERERTEFHSTCLLSDRCLVLVSIVAKQLQPKPVDLRWEEQEALRDQIQNREPHSEVLVSRLRTIMFFMVNNYSETELFVLFSESPQDCEHQNDSKQKRRYSTIGKRTTRASTLTVTKTAPTGMANGSSTP